MEFPDDILKIIKEYAQPVTLPNWRYLHKMTEHNFTEFLLYNNAYTLCSDKDQLYALFMNYLRHSRHEIVD